MSHTRNSIPKGRMLSEETIDNYADEIIGVLQIWGFSRTDAYRAAKILSHKLSAWPVNKPWGSPLEGTPYKGDVAVEGGLSVRDQKGGFTFGALGENKSDKKPN